MPSRINISIPLPSSDGKYHGRYPAGNAPGAQLVGAASSVTSAVGAILTGIALAAGATDATSAAAALSTGGGGATFDYYISTTGSDANVGTLASPWAITSLSRLTQNASNVANHAALTGKKVGLIGGTYAINGLWNSATYEDPALTIPAGSSGSPTYIASCNSSGVYTRGVAQITASTSGVPGSGPPSTTASTAIIGQYYGSTQGYMTLDGVTISDGCGYGFAIFVNTGSPVGITVQNCEIYSGTGSEGNNPAACMISGNAAFSFINNKVHDWQLGTAGDGNHNCAGFFTLGNSTLSGSFLHNTVYNTNASVYHKNGSHGAYTHAYNYYENNGTDPGGNFVNSGTNVTGATLTLHHNIFVGIAGNIVIDGHMDSVTPADTPSASVVMYSNTTWIISTGNPQVGLFWQAEGTAVSPTASATHYNNVWAGGAGGSGGGTNTGLIMYNTATSAIALSDYNGYVGTSAPKFAIGNGTLFSPTTGYAGLSAVQSGLSIETHSFAQSSTTGVFSNPGVGQTPAGYTLGASSPAKNAGTTTGLSNGTACDQGAYGYDPGTGLPNPTVGSDF